MTTRSEENKLRTVQQALWDRCPKTADGVPVISGDTVYINVFDDRKIVSYTLKCIGHSSVPLCYFWEGNTAWPVSGCYSTREAAEAARKEPH